jgi:long-chain fatty acid transport protein
LLLLARFPGPPRLAADALQASERAGEVGANDRGFLEFQELQRKCGPPRETIRPEVLSSTRSDGREVEMKHHGSHAQRALLFGAGIFLAAAAAAHGQTNAEVNAGIQFNFSSPGARSLGLGGAFIGLADDATAAFTNPAGLIQLSKPEVSAEGRASRFTSEFTDRGRGLGTPSTRGVDNVSGIVPNTSHDEINNLSFASFVYPRGRWAAAVYRQEAANFATSFKTQGIFAPNAFLARLFPISTALSLRIVNVGVSGALRVTDALSIGVGLSEYHFNLSSLTNRYFTDSSLPDNTPGSFYGPPDYSASNVEFFQTLDGSDNGVAVNAGLLWKISSKWSAGVVYRQGPRFKFGTATTVGARVGPPLAGTLVASDTAHFHVPDVYGAGVVFKPADAWTITVDYDRIRYSQLARGTIDIFDTMSMQDPFTKDLAVDDGNEFHLGVEYVLTQLKYPLALRLGGWRDPAHKVRFNGAATDATMDPLPLSVLFRPGRVEGHASGGLGLVFGERFQLDAAYDYSRVVSIASLSGVFRF